MSPDEKLPDDAIPLESQGEPIPLVGGDSSDDDAGTGDLLATTDAEAGGRSSRIRTFESQSGLAKPGMEQFRRSLNTTGQGATRVRTFHTKLNDAAMRFMDQQIAEWIDSHDDIEVKLCSTTVGVVEGKRSEPHLIVTVWY